MTEVSRVTGDMVHETGRTVSEAGGPQLGDLEIIWRQEDECALGPECHFLEILNKLHNLSFYIRNMNNINSLCCYDDQMGILLRYLV